MSSCLSGGGGGGRAYGLDLDFAKSSARSSSPSSTLSDSTSSHLSISTKRPRAPRKRPNQSYNEAAALLSAACPTVFSSTKCLACKHPARPFRPFSEPPALLPPFPALADAAFLIRDTPPVLPASRFEPRRANSVQTPCRSPPGIGGSPSLAEDDDFDAESILDEEVEEGIDTIMGNLSTSGGGGGEDNGCFDPCLGSLVGFGLGELNVRQALRRGPDDWDWWRSPTVAIRDIVPKFKKLSSTTATEKKKKNNRKKKDVVKDEEELEEITACATTSTASSSQENLRSCLGLKLDYEGVLTAWSDSRCPYSDGPPESLARLAQIDLSPEAANCGRVKEVKRRTRLSSKKIWYQVRKANAEQSPG